MALFQPTNIIPSTFSGKGKNVVDLTDILSVQWQINGTSAMKGYQIDFFQNDAASTPVHSTGAVFLTSAAYGTDKKGNYVPYTYYGTDTWSGYGFADGGEYKLKITQFFDSITSNKMSYSNEYGTIAEGTKCYIVANGGYYLFAAPIDIVSGMTIDRINGNMLIFDYDNIADHGLISLYATFTGTYSPGMGTPVSGSGTTRDIDNIVTQYSDAVFIVRAMVSLMITANDPSFNMVSNTFYAYAGSLLDPRAVNSVRWRLSMIDNNVTTIIEDTGAITTGVMEYFYDGFLPNKQYQIYCEVEVADGEYMISNQLVFTPIFALSPASPANLTACIYDKDGAAKLTWTPPTLTASADRRMIHRYEDGVLKKLYTYTDGTNKIKDFGAVSLKDYNYYVLYALQPPTYTLQPYQVSDDICKRLTSYYLYEATEDDTEPNVYHVKNIWRFGNNYSGGSISNGNAPQFLANFTKYPLRQGSTVLPKSGTLTALLSNFVDGEYIDTAEQMEKLFALSLSENHIFLKDTKGNIYEVHTSAPISQTVNTASRLQEVTVSVPWQEIAEASDAILIQTPADEGWYE